MQVEQMLWTQATGWNKKPELSGAHIVFYFGGRDVLSTGTPFKELFNFYPKAHILGCSTGGEIYNADVLDDSVAIAAIGFYSYGEIYHQQFTGKCGFHNQTMTVTTLHEE